MELSREGIMKKKTEEDIFQNLGEIYFFSVLARCTVRTVRIME